MGWLFSHSDTRAQTIERLTKEQTYLKTVAKAAVGNTLYVVHEIKPGYRTGSGSKLYPGARFIAVYLLRPGGKHEGWGYKDMDESMGPSQRSCPLTLLDLVKDHEPISETAKEWREACRRFAEAKKGNRARLQPGVKFRLYGKGYEVCQRIGAAVIVRKDENGGIYKLANDQIASVSFLSEEEAKAADAIIESLDNGSAS